VGSQRLFDYEPRPLTEYETVALLKSTESARAASKELTAGELGEARRQELQQRVEQGRRARNQLVAEHLSSAQYHGRCFATTCRGRRHSVEDLTQEALLGLLRAIEMFNPQAGYRFSGYAEIHMREAVRRFLSNDAKRRRDLEDSAA
jgi:DNA-directed RNA polymerase sigma subunit (sigma70/sigma32)